MKFLQHGWTKDGGRWHWRIGFERYPKGGLELFFTRVLTHFRWRPWPGDGEKFCEYVGVQLRWDLPMRIGAQHIYYDGPHCFYQLGPLTFVECWRWCTKCSPEL